MWKAISSTVLAGAILMAAGQVVVAQQTGDAAAAKTTEAAPSPAGCTNQTVDIYGKTEGIAYRYWMLTLQKLVKEDDRKGLSEVMNYPLQWNRKDASVEIKTRNEFLKNYDAIFTAELKTKIATQNVKCLPADDEGANVGNGELRFSKFAEDTGFRVTSITQPGIVKSNKLPWE
jgi:uncharacterized protein YijF (DUF1287 family)